MQRLVKFLSVAFVLLFLSNCGESKDPKTLVMGTSADYPPFSMITNKKVEGFEVDLANMIVAKLGYSLKVKDMAFHSIIPALQTQKIDFAISAISVTPERLKNLDFSEEYYESVFAMLYKIDKPLKNIDELEGSKIGVQLGSTMEVFLKDASQYKKFNILAIASNNSLIQELNVGRIDGVLLEEPQAKAFKEKNSNLDYSLFPDKNRGYVIAFQKGSALKEQFDSVLDELKQSGELDALKEKWQVGKATSTLVSAESATEQESTKSQEDKVDITASIQKEEPSPAAKVES